MSYEVLLQKVQALRKDDALGIKYCWIDISNQPLEREAREAYISQQFQQELVGQTTDISAMLTLQQLIMRHYMKHDAGYWNNFLDAWLPKCHKVAFAYVTNKMHPSIFDGSTYNTFVCGVCLLIEGTFMDVDGSIGNHARDVYVRCICSNCHSGGRLLKFVKTQYTQTNCERLRLHSEPNERVISFYRKHNFVMLDECIVDVHGLRYPTMICSIRPYILTRPGERLRTEPFSCKEGGVLKATVVDWVAKLSWHVSLFLGH